MDNAKIKQYIEAAGYETRSYSGRGMYGKRCLAVDVDSEEPVNVVLSIISAVSESGENDSECLDNIFELCSELQNAKTDSMGKGQIIYWPDIEWTGV